MYAMLTKNICYMLIIPFTYETKNANASSK